MTREFWLAHLAAIEQEGISTHAYAKRHALAAKSLYRWQRKLRVAATATSCASNGTTFVALRVAEAEPGVARYPLTVCTLMLEPGVRLEMTTLPAPEWLGRAVQRAH